METYLMISGAVLICGVFVCIIRNPGILKKITASAVTGIMALAVVDLTTGFTGISLAVSVWTVATAVILGLPGVVSLLFLKIIWGL